MKVLLSIKPEFVDSIQNGDKQYEYRKIIFRRPDITTIVVYATKPRGKVIGEFEIGEILEDNPEELWQATKKKAGITEDFFKEYFFNRDRGFAIKINSFIEYDEPLDLYQISESLRVPPQSFCYIE